MVGKIVLNSGVALAVAMSPIAFIPAYSQTAFNQSEAARSEIETVATEFVAAFNGLDKARFDTLWAEDATVFFPQHPFPIRRVSGKAEVLQWFHRFFDARKGRNLSIEPRDMLIQTDGRSAVVTFHLGDNPDAAGRRTLVLRNEAGSWKIAHLHASTENIPSGERG